MSHEWREGDTWETFKARAAAERVTAALQLERAVAEQEAHQIDWYLETSHCGACGQPGVFCICRTPCACADLHEVGSGLAADPAEVFAETAISDDQAELFPVEVPE